MTRTFLFCWSFPSLPWKLGLPPTFYSRFSVSHLNTVSWPSDNISYPVLVIFTGSVHAFTCLVIMVGGFKVEWKVVFVYIQTLIFFSPQLWLACVAVSVGGLASSQVEKSKQMGVGVDNSGSRQLPHFGSAAASPPIPPPSQHSVSNSFTRCVCSLLAATDHRKMGTGMTLLLLNCSFLSF